MVNNMKGSPVTFTSGGWSPGPRPPGPSRVKSKPPAGIGGRAPIGGWAPRAVMFMVGQGMEPLRCGPTGKPSSWMCVPLNLMEGRVPLRPSRPAKGPAAWKRHCEETGQTSVVQAMSALTEP